MIMIKFILQAGLSVRIATVAPTITGASFVLA